MKFNKFIIAALGLAAVAMTSHAGDTKWYAGEEMQLLGKGVDPACTANRYQRLPDSLKNIVTRDAVYYLGTNSAGMALRFASDSPYIKVRWKSPNKYVMDHMPATGSRGLDLYALEEDSTWRFVDVARPNLKEYVTETTIIADMKPVRREYMLYLSLYDGVDSLYVGIDEASHMETPAVALPAAGNPIVFYGTSIMQGGCANRPGMCHTNQLQRRLNREILNFGFSGNGQLDLEVADVLAAVKNPAMYVLDFVPNCTVAQIDTLMEPFVAKLEAAHPGVPILFVEDPEFPHKRFNMHVNDKVNRLNATLLRNYEKLTAKYPNLYYLPSTDIIGHDGEATVDGIHFTDLGFTRFSNVMEPILRQILQ